MSEQKDIIEQAVWSSDYACSLSQEQWCEELQNRLFDSINKTVELLSTQEPSTPKIVADLLATSEPTNAPWSTDGLGRAIRAVKAHNRTLLAAGYTDEQIVGIINTSIKECGDKLTVDSCFDWCRGRFAVRSRSIESPRNVRRAMIFLRSQ